MTNPWGDPEKIVGAMDFAERLVGDISSLQKDLGEDLHTLKHSEQLRKVFFLLVLKLVKQEHTKGGSNYEDVGYIIDKLMVHIFGNDALEVTNKFYKDGLFKDINNHWSVL